MYELCFEGMSRILCTVQKEKKKAYSLLPRQNVNCNIRQRAHDHALISAHHGWRQETGT